MLYVLWLVFAFAAVAVGVFSACVVDKQDNV